MLNSRFTSSFVGRAASRGAARVAPRGQALQSLVASEGLRDRFFSWRGLSGRSYVCSVFQAGEEGFVADVVSGLVIGVARDGGVARPVCVFLARGDERRGLRDMAREFDVAEWHVHFCADARTVRDLSAALLN